MDLPIDLRLPALITASLLIFSTLNSTAMAQPPRNRVEGMQRQTRPQPQAKHTSSPPEYALELLCDAFNQTGETRYWTSSVVGGDSFNPSLPELREELKRNRGTFFLTYDKPQIQINGKEATLIVQITLQNNLFQRITQTETLQLRQLELEVQTLWQFVPGKPEEVAIDPDGGILLRTATFLAFPQEMLDIVQLEVSLKNLKSLALGALMYDADWKGQTKLMAEDFKKAVLPYVRQEQLFYSSADKSGNVSYSFNSKIADKMNQATKPDETIMLYEGKEGQLEFRHNNRAAVAFVSGKVRLVTPEEAKVLRWQP